MKNIIFKVLTLCVLLVSVLCCGPGKRACVLSSGNQQPEYQGRIVNLYNMPVTPWQLDSICVADTLSQDLNHWLKQAYRDVETKTTIFKYTYIKRGGTPGETMWIITEFPDSMSVIKRVRK